MPKNKTLVKICGITSINQAVESQVGQVQKEVGMNKLTNELEKRGLNDNQEPFF